MQKDSDRQRREGKDEWEWVDKEKRREEGVEDNVGEKGKEDGWMKAKKDMWEKEDVTERDEGWEERGSREKDMSVTQK